VTLQTQIPALWSGHSGRETKINYKEAISDLCYWEKRKQPVWYLVHGKANVLHGGQQGEGVRGRWPNDHTQLSPPPALTFRSSVLGFLTGSLFMLSSPKLLVEWVEVALPEPGQLLIIFHSIPPAGPA
jgi:hypothetical protein